MTEPNWISYLSDHFGLVVTKLESLSGGCVGEVYRATASETQLVVKVDSQARGHLIIEGQMLKYLRGTGAIVVPEVYFSSAKCLVMSYLKGETGVSTVSEAEAAIQLAALHNLTSASFGFDFDTCIGGLHQPNKKSDSWVSFFGEQRLLHMGRAAAKCDHLLGTTFTALEELVTQLDQFIEEPPRPALIHGDIWSGNVLSSKDQFVGFIDPAIYFADPEIELAFIEMFSTFGPRFYQVYQERHTIREGFWEQRKEIYNLYPLLVHAVLFGGSYAAQVQATLHRHGF
jgi:fructosamine-3-kinase